jgi:glycosyltransferase involved in cell wall biosynthesis
VSAHLPKVSVCVPTYNGAQYLRPCLESVLSQSFDDYELVIVDDRSSDDTVDIVREYGALDSRIRLVENSSNLGLVGNWNRCIDLARANWLKFVFQDDVLAPNCIADMIAATPSGYPVISSARDFIFDTSVTEQDKRPYLANRTLIEAIYSDRNSMSGREFCDVTLDNIAANLVGEPTAVLLRVDVFRRFGRFDDRLLTYCDAEYWTRVICHTGTLHIPDVLANFRVHRGATSAINVANRAFRSSVLDKLIIRHEIAFADVYRPLRSAAADRRPPLDLIESFWEQVHWVSWQALQAAEDVGNPDPVPLLALNELATRLPRVSAIPRRYRALRRWRSIQRRAGRWLGVGQ